RRRRRVSRLVTRVARGPRKRDHIADVAESGCVRDGPLESETEARMRHRAIPSQIAIPAVMLTVEAGGGHPRIENVESFLALAAADDFSDARGQNVHRGDGAIVVVDAHVESLDLLRIVDDDHLLFRVLLRSEEHTSELQSPYDLVCRLQLEKKKK